MYKTHTCGELRLEHVGQSVKLAGWVNARRDHGGLIFLDLRDRWGIIQVVANPEQAAAAHAAASHARNEYVLQVDGVVCPRLAGKENPKLDTGAIEVEVTALQVLNPSKPTPFLINEDQPVDENVRLKYRYLDLRRERMRRNLNLRYQMIKFIRDYLDGERLWKWRRRSYSRPRPRAPATTWCRRAYTLAAFTRCRSRRSSSSSC